MERILQAINKSPLFSVWMSVLMALIALGAYGVLLSLLFGMDVFKFHHAIPWTIKISTYIFFVGSCTGISMITSLGHIFGVKRFELIGKRAAFLALITVTFGMMAIVLHLGHPERSFFFYLTPNIRSAIWGMSFFYT
ncbi:MAG: NrfD/PsrC family molybdoenzyme membrane anchor subunit, partial [Nitrospirota bacterium]|nr:NrfD/PsrC family molybdoenzyme membrane anchor subunit [Nitrospirota bacterium]